MPKSKNSGLEFDNICICGCSIIGGILSFGYTLYGLYYFLPVWLDSLLAFVLLTPLVILITGLLIKAGMLIGMIFGICLYLIYTCVLGLFSFLNLISSKKPIINKITKEPTISTPMTAKEKLELKVGLIGMGYTALFISIAILTDVPAALLFIGWLVVSAIVSVFANKQLQHITSQ